MIDPKLLRADPDGVRQGLARRGGRDLPALEECLRLDAKHQTLLKEVEDLRAKSNAASERIGKAKAAKDEGLARTLMAEIAAVKETMRAREAALSAAAAASRRELLGLPNPPDASVPPGKSEADNVERRKSGPPKTFAFKALDHQALGERLGILALPRATSLSGARFPLWMGAGARLIRAIINFQVDLHADKHGYHEVWPPYLVRGEVLEATGQLPKFEEDLYKVPAAETEALYLIPTAEVPLTNLVRNTILPADPAKKYVAYTPCFRREAGSYGKDTRGVIRNHQFDKVELVWVVRPEDSMKALDELTGHAEAVLKAVGVPYRVIELCAADLGFAALKTYDLEAWMPSENRYREISSCSNCGDFQARRMNARFRREAKAAPEHVHTLNGSGVAVGRLCAAILENFQRGDGSVEVPAVLRPYFGAKEILPA